MIFAKRWDVKTVRTAILGIRVSDVVTIYRQMSVNQTADAGRTVTMQKGLFKKNGLEGLFTDFKHHARSWRNSKKMRVKRERQWLKKLRKDGE